MRLIRRPQSIGRISFRHGCHDQLVACSLTPNVACSASKQSPDRELAVLSTGPVLIKLMAHRCRSRCHCRCAKRCQSAQHAVFQFAARRCDADRRRSRTRTHVHHIGCYYDVHPLAYWPVTACDRPSDAYVEMASGARDGLNYSVGGERRLPTVASMRCLHIDVSLI